MMRTEAVHDGTHAGPADGALGRLMAVDPAVTGAKIAASHLPPRFPDPVVELARAKKRHVRRFELDAHIRDYTT
jgi:hypothetical protein